MSKLLTATVQTNMYRKASHITSSWVMMLFTLTSQLVLLYTFFERDLELEKIYFNVVTKSLSNFFKLCCGYLLYIYISSVSQTYQIVILRNRSNKKRLILFVCANVCHCKITFIYSVLFFFNLLMSLRRSDTNPFLQLWAETCLVDKLTSSPESLLMVSTQFCQALCQLQSHDCLTVRW